MTRTSYINVCSLRGIDVPYKILLQSVKWFLRRRYLLKVWTDNRLRYTISSPCEPLAQRHSDKKGRAKSIDLNKSAGWSHLIWIFTVCKAFVWSVELKELMYIVCLQYKQIFDEVSPHLEDVLAANHFGVAVALAEACRKLGTRQDKYRNVSI